jgi:nucleotidyltransferase/DNA polymerase involved in DNA repair
MIVCVVVPFFAAGVERLLQPALAAIPLVISEPAQAPQRVYAVSDEAACEGIKPGMPLRQAQLLCPQAQIIPAQLSKYQRIYDDLLAVLAHFTHRIEPDSGRPAAISYLDLGQLAKTEPAALAQQIGRRIRDQVGLVPSLGLASCRFPAYVAALSTTPGKARLAPPGREAAFLAQRPLDLLPLDEETSRRCQLLGLRTLGQFAALPAGAVLNQFGSYGRWLHRPGARTPARWRLLNPTRLSRSPAPLMAWSPIEKR